jgi:hypothetical protein
MKRMRVMGLCLAALFALCAMVVASASAETAPSYKVCVKAAKSGKLYTGKYTDSKCSKAASEAEIKEGKKNKYERAEWTSAKKKGFKGKNKGNPHNNLINPLTGEGKPGKNEGTTECTKESVVGEVTGPKTEKWKTVYTHCEAQESECNTAGAKNGEIKTEELEGTLVFLNKEKTKVGPRVKGLGKGGELAQYECLGGTLKVEVYGEVMAEVTGNINITNNKTKTEVKEGPLAMQSVLYPEETNTESEGKQYFEWGYGYQACIAEQVGKGKTVAEAEGICFVKLGPWKSYPNKPVSLVSKITGIKTAEAPATQNGVTESTGEKFLIET